MKRNNHSDPKRLKTALIGAFVCSLLGPTLGSFAILGSEIAHESSMTAVLGAPLVLPWVWPMAVMLVGPGAFVLGGAGALIIQFLSTRVVTSKALVVQIVAVGTALGSVVPAVSNVVLGEMARGWDKKFSIGLVPLGAVTGIICAAATCWVLKRMGLLHGLQSRGPEQV